MKWSINIFTAGDKFMPEMHFKQLEFTYSLVVHLLKQRKNGKIHANRKYRLNLQK